MASTIKLKNGSGEPLASDLVQGEPALDLTNKRLYTEDSGGTVIEVGTNPTEITTGDLTATGTTTLAGATTSADINFGDNDKAIFGAGDDLQIYHDGSNSYIADEGTGELFISGASSVGILNGDRSEYMINAVQNGAVTAYHNGSAKLATTNTGIDVTGTVTADGLTVSTATGSSSITPTDITIKTETSASDWSTTDEWGRLVFYSDDVSNGGAKPHATIGVSPTASGGGLSNLVFKTSNSTPSLVKRMDIDEVGNISFYEDTGVTPKLFWDASAESLGIGTTSPMLNSDGILGLEIRGDTAPGLTISNSTGGHYYSAWVDTSDNFKIQDNNNNATRLTIDSSGNVGIGVTPSSWGSAGATGLQVGTSLALGYTNATGSFIGGNSYYSASGWKRVASGGASAYILGGDGSHIWYGTSTSSTADSAITFSQPMTLDASGNLLVGTTTNTFNDVGIRARSSGNFVATRDGSTVAGFNRKTSDGEILQFAKDGSTVGSIGTFSAGNTYFKGDSTSHSVGAGDTGVQYNATNDQVRPYNVGSGSTRDAAIDIGGTGARFKDLYLSGAVYLNTTGNPSTTGQGSAFVTSTNNKRVLQLATTVSTSEVMAAFYNSNGFVGGISTSGSSTSYGTSSDYRLKENVVNMTGAVDRVKALNPSQFNFIADPNTTVDGFLAHEVSDVVPEAVTGTKDAMTTEEYEVTPAVLDDDGNVVTEAVMGTREVPDYQGIDQSKLVPLLTGALQEAIARIETLEAQVATLQGN